jgi:DNA-binding HxlR family transcriptional regulator
MGHKDLLVTHTLYRQRDYSKAHDVASAAPCSELERAVPGISQCMLSQQLRLLKKCELVKRTVHPQFPPKVEYELTEFGKTLCPAMKTLVDWR